MATSAKKKLITVFGGSGFLGRHVVRTLAKRDWRIRVAARRPNLANHLMPLGTVGQIQPVQANLRNQESVERAIDGASAVINLVGILCENGSQTFNAVQKNGPETIAKACKTAGVSKLVHVSAIGADENSESKYAQTKAAGEQAAFENFYDTIVIRPSIIFGPEDSFFNKFGEMLKLSPILPLIGGGSTKFQPVFVGDVAESVWICVEGQVKSGTTLELGGSEIKTFRECMEMLLEITNRNRILLPVPFGPSKILGGLLQFAPGKPLTTDQVKLLVSDNVVSEKAIKEKRTLEGIGITPQTLATVLPKYLWQFRCHGQFEQSTTT